jgi:GTP-binding protein
MAFKVAIVGRPNVGKSTLFNRLVGRRVAIVHDRPGVTRDRRDGQGGIADMSFSIIDTAGLEDDLQGVSIEGRMRKQTDRAIAEADVALFLIDARAGVTPLDSHFADYLRKSPTPVILVANKCEGKAGAPGLYECFSLGLGEPVPFSAEHGQGLDDLYEALLPYARQHGGIDAPEDDENAPWPDLSAEDDIEDGDVLAEQEKAEAERPLSLAIVGRPNVGKSTLVNALLQDDRMLTGPEAGLTRDAITSEWEYKGRIFRLVDTAGLRRRANVTDQVERLSTSNTIEAIRMAHVVVLVMDADAILDKQDLTIARLVIDEGRALVIAINKWDQVADREASLQRLKDRLETSLPQVRGVPTVTISALAGRGLDKLMGAVNDIYVTWNKRVPTSQLNRWLIEMTERHPPPATVGGNRLRLKYMTQVRTRPPSFAVFTQRADELPESYTRYLINGLREDFDLKGVPIRFGLRKRKNPYADD